MRKVKYIITILGIIAVGIIINRTALFNGLTPTDIQNYVSSFGIYAPIIYIVLFTVVPLTLFPDAILAIASGMAFGLIGGFIYTMIGALCGATLAFYLTRSLGREVLKPLIGDKLNKLESKIEHNGFIVVLLLRLIPLFPFDIISYSAGLSKVKYKDFILATVVGTIPGIFVFTNIGDKSLDIGSDAFYVSLVLLVLLLLFSLTLKKKFIVKNMKDS